MDIQISYTYMEPLYALIFYGWIFPALLLTVHTLITIGYMQLRPIGSRVPTTIGVSILMFIYGPFEMKVCSRPKSIDVLGFLIVGLAPVVSIIILFLYVVQIYICIDVQSNMVKHKPSRKHRRK